MQPRNCSDIAGIQPICCLCRPPGDILRSQQVTDERESRLWQGGLSAFGACCLRCAARQKTNSGKQP
jgi:hypothetical protein